MPLKLSLFLALSLALLLGMHYACFRSIIYFFQINRPLLKTFLYTVMVLLSFSFMSAFMLIHWRETIWTISYYKMAAVWMGFLLHLLVAVSAAWLILGGCRLIGFTLPAKHLATAALIIAAAGSGYGMWAAFHPVVRNVIVPVKQVPVTWENKTIVHLSDLHSGHFHQSGFTRRIVEAVNDLEPDLLLVTGDLLDGMGGPYSENLAPLNDLRVKRGMFFVTGNHEHYVGLPRALRIIEKTPLRILDNEAVVIDNLEIVGVSYPGISRLTRIANLPSRRKPGTARIILFHTPTEMDTRADTMEDRHFANYWMPDTTYDLNKQIGADVQLSGHTHHGQLFPINGITRLLYKGHDYGLSTDGGFQLFTTCGTGSWGPPMRTAGRPEIVRIRLEQRAD